METKDLAFDIETKKNELFAKLDSLCAELGGALEKYHAIAWEEYWYIEAAYQNVEYAWFDDLIDLDADNIEASALFSWFDPMNKEDVAMYNDLLRRLKEKEELIQAHLLWFMELLSVYVLNKKSNQIALDGGDVKSIKPTDVPEKVKGDAFLKIVFDNPEVSSDYRMLLKRMFDLMDTDAKMMVSVSEELHKHHWDIINQTMKNDAESISGLFQEFKKD